MIRYNKIDYFTYILSGSLIKISRLKFFVFQKRNSQGSTCEMVESLL